MKMKLFFAIVCIEAITIALILGYISRHQTGSFLSVSPLSPSLIKQFSSDTLDYFYEPKPNTTETVRRDWLSYSPTYHINSDGLNERYEYKEEKEEGVFRIITLGDSFTFGAYVDTKANWTELLEDVLNKKYLCSQIKKYEVINLGMDGYDTAYEVERYMKRGKKYAPDLIVILVTDFGRVTEHRLSRKRVMPTLTMQEKEDYRKKGNYYAETNRFDGELTHEDRVEYQKKHFKRLMATYTNPLLLVDFSLDDTYKNDITNLAGQYKSVRLMRMELRRNDKQYILPDWHPNMTGHKKIMEEILEQLASTFLLPCTK